MITEELEFFMPFEHVPTTTAQQARVINVRGRLRKYDNPGLSRTRWALYHALKPFVPGEPFEGPVEFAAEWRFEYKKGHKDGEYKETRPDTDNLNKLLKDLMTELGFWEDDKQVVVEHIKKVWDKTDPGIYVWIRKVGRFEDYKMSQVRL